MTKRIFRSIWLVALLVFLASLALILGVIYDHYSDLQQQQLKNRTQLVAQAAAHEGLKYFEGLQIDDCRITWIASDGTVLYDNRSESEQMENHMEREEIREALESGHGESARYSDTLMERSIYCAQRLPDGTVLRLAGSQSSVLTLILGMAQPICLVIALALVVSWFLAFQLSRRIVEPLNKLNLEAPLSADCYPELTPLLRRIDAQQQQLRSQTMALVRKQNEFDTVTNSMSEGLVLLSSRCTILTMNTAARHLLKLSHRSVGTDILSYDPNLSDLLLKALHGHRAEKILSLPEGEYQVDASPVYTDDVISGVVLLLFDVTEKLRSEQHRREFTANVSHELKTPLQAISGYAELIAHGIARAEDVETFAGNIYTEAQRMIRLVEDIIRLSQLDEGAGDQNFEILELLEAAKSVAASRMARAESAGVTLRVEGEITQAHCIPRLMVTVMTNLCDNAIKYNRPGGSVTLRVETEGKYACLSVADTGIGIPPEHHSRIFERFYRVDKSHSKAVGGTGLGLSIVKHAVLIHNGRVHLNSTPGKGTTITVRIPLKPTENR